MDLVSSVLVETQQAVMTITMNRPRVRNAIDQAMSEGVARALDEFEARTELRVAILSGAGGTFSSGADLKAYLRGEDLRIGSRGMLGLLRRRPAKPLIAAVEGYALGGGFEAALACDLLVAARDAVFGLPESRRGLAATGGGLVRLPRLIPERIAMEIVLTGEAVGAERLHGYGLINRLVDTGDALEEARRLAASVVAAAPKSVAVSRSVILAQRHLSEEDGFAAQDHAARDIGQSADAREGARAFAEKRSPKWAVPR